MASQVLSRGVGTPYPSFEPDPVRDGAGDGDDILLARFVERGDAAAFEVLVRRYGPMVYGLCRRQIADPTEIDDAFQAVFLVLVKRANTIQTRTTVGPWLYGVARKVSGKMRFRRCQEPPRPGGAFPEPVAPPAAVVLESQEVAAVHEEIDRLPALYREVVILHFLHGMTHAAIAKSLKCPKGTIATRLLEAKKRLHGRLTARGFGAVALAILPQMLAPQAVPATLMAATVGQASAAVPPLIALTAFTKLAVAVVSTIAVALGVALIPGGFSSGLSRSPVITSQEVDPVANELSVRPQLDSLDKREVPAVLTGSIPGQGAWRFDTVSQVMTVTGNDQDNSLSVVAVTGGTIKIDYETTGARGPGARIDTGVVANGRVLLRIDGGKGNDALKVVPIGSGDATNQTEAPFRRIEMRGGAGNDLIEYERTGAFNNIAIPVYADGGAGDDKLRFAPGYGNDASSYGSFGESIYRYDEAARTRSAITESFLPATFDLNGGAGNDQITFDRRAAKVTGGAGQDKFNFTAERPFTTVTLAQFQSAIPNNDYKASQESFDGSGTKANSFR